MADRITLIAGHNGIGKSTILGLIANGSGIRGEGFQSYLNRPFEANIHEIVHLDHKREYEDYKANPDLQPSPHIEYDFNGEPLLKRCSITSTKRSTGPQVRVVPRNNPYKDLSDSRGNVILGKDAKVPLPTLYLGMTRMLPVGESNPDWVTSAPDTTIDPEDAEFIHSFISGVIGVNLAKPKVKNITTQGIKGTGKTAKHPDYPHSPKCISLGQDSLSAIATALASFKRLKREWDEYPGGLLVVDELDAGFHPAAQQKLMKAISSAARDLKLQVIATTHSLCLIETIHPEAQTARKGGKYVDSIVYLTDSHHPRVADDYSLEDLRRDMHMIPPPAIKASKRKDLKIYLEDAEANFFLKRLLTRGLKSRVKKEAGVSLKPIPLSMGGDNLKGVFRHDPYFKTVLIAVDADSPVNTAAGSPKHIVQLPGGVDNGKRGMNPERTVYTFIQDLIDNRTAHPDTWVALKKAKLTSDFLAELLEGDWNITDRKSAKKWMKAKLDKIEQWKLVELWLKENPDKVKSFEDAIVKAAIATAKLAFPA